MSTPNKIVAVPEKLLNATKSKSSYFELVIEYQQKYNLPSSRAYKLLEDDLVKYGFPPKFSNRVSFYKARDRFFKSIKKKK